MAIIVILGLAGGAAYYYKHRAAEPEVFYRTVQVVRGDLQSTISATGTLQPEEVVDVGAQVAGKIDSFGRDPHNPDKFIDFGSEVEEGTILANIDSTSYQSRVDQAEAALARAKADLAQLEARCEQAKQEWLRAEELRPKKAIADTDYDLAVANYKAARANVEVGLAAIKQAEASLRQEKINLGYTVIKSPVRGVIIARRVNIGQTVVASLNAPSLFLIAKDLRRMQVWASVNEADIGRIRVGMPVRFTVDAFPGETFRGEVMQIRMNAQMTQNVVTYTVVVTTDNPDLKLLPYLTANVQFEVESRTRVLLAPNTALRWKPEESQIAVAVPVEDNDGAALVWTPTGQTVRPLRVRLGITDGLHTEISGDDLTEGTLLVIGIGQTSKDVADQQPSANPFLPQLRRNQRPPPLL